MHRTIGPFIPYCKAAEPLPRFFPAAYGTGITFARKINATF
jgi:hypothetical protein